MRKSFWVAIGIMLVGLVILLWPDTGERLVRFNEAHDPSYSDLIGIILLLVTWAWMVIKSFTRRGQVIALLGKRNLGIALLVIVLGTSIIIWGLTTEDDLLLYAGIIFATVGWLALFVTAFYEYPGEKKVVGLPRERLN